MTIVSGGLGNPENLGESFDGFGNPTQNFLPSRDMQQNKLDHVYIDIFSNQIHGAVS